MHYGEPSGDGESKAGASSTRSFGAALFVRVEDQRKPSWATSTITSPCVVNLIALSGLRSS
jgi:hypothetical protein